MRPPKPKQLEVRGDFLVHKALSLGRDRVIRCALCLIFGHDRKQSFSVFMVALEFFVLKQLSNSHQWDWR